MKIGVFLAYGPKTPLKAEGLGRYVATLIKGFQSTGHEVVLACPQWIMPYFMELCEDYGISEESMDFIVSYKRPVLWDIYTYFTREKKKKKPRKFLYRIGDIAEKLIASLMMITNAVLFLLLVMFGIVGSVALLPVGALLFLGYLGYKFLKAVATKGKKEVKTWVKIANRFFVKFTKKGISLYSLIMDNLTNTVEGELVEKINRLNLTVDVWFSPSAFWPTFNKIEGVRVVNLPDVVSAEFPLLFSSLPGITKSTQRVLDTLSHADFIVTYSEYMKKEMTKYVQTISMRQIAAIPHPVNDMDRFIRMDPFIVSNLQLAETFVTSFTRDLLSILKINISSEIPRVRDYVRSLDFSDVKYIFYASQSRPHKNILNFLKAYEHLLRKRYCNIKLVLTGDVEADEQIKKYILDNRLEFDVLCFHHVSSQQLAALYSCAELVVNPTLYEGGFPFTFAEGMSVGTPSVMSNIPQVEEVVKDFQLEEMLFDPYNWSDIAQKIEYGLNYRNELFQKEQALYHELKKRTSDVVASEYIEVFQYFIKINKRLSEKNEKKDCK